MERGKKAKERHQRLTVTELLLLNIQVLMITASNSALKFLSSPWYYHLL